MTGDEFTITAATGKWVVRAGGAIIGESSKAVEVQEGNLPPVIYFPRADIAMEFLDRSDHKTSCPVKGDASYFSVVGKSSTLENVAWGYEAPNEGVERIAGLLTFDPRKTAVEQV